MNLGVAVFFKPISSQIAKCSKNVHLSFQMAPRMAAKASLKRTHPEVLGCSEMCQKTRTGLISQSHIAKTFFVEKQKKVVGGCKNMALWGSLKKTNSQAKACYLMFGYG